MPFPFSINGKLEIKAFTMKPENFRDTLVSSLSEIQGYSIRADGLKIIITFLWSSLFRAGGGVLKGLSKGEISLHPKGMSLAVKYKFSTVHILISCAAIVGLLFVINIRNPVTTSSLGFKSLGLLWIALSAGMYILTAILTSLRFPRFLKKCAIEASNRIIMQ